MKSILLAVLIGVLALCAALAIRLGAFLPVALESREAGPFLFVYRNHLGPYHGIVPVIQAVESWAKSAKEPCTLSFGEYLDDPRQVDEDRLRSRGGCIVSRKPEGLPEGFESRVQEKRTWLTASFRGAPSIGPFKVYPKAAEWIQDNGFRQEGPTIETYRVLSEKDVETTYYFPIARRGDEAGGASTTSPREGK